MAARRIIRRIQNDDDELQQQHQPQIRRFRDILNPFDGLNEFQIIQRYRFPSPIILEITDLLRQELEKPTKRSRPIPPVVEVCITLRFLASNSFHQVVGDTFLIAKSTVCRAIWRCLKALVLHLPQFVKFPTAHNELMRITRKFYDVAQFPNVIGLIDCTHVRIIAPAEFENVYVNRKSFHSINVQGVCDADGYITNINTQWPGSTHDARIFRESAICTYLETMDPANGHLLGDSGYGCKPYLLTPYLRTDGLQHKEKYNIAHRRTRVLIEQIFGRLKRRFSILHGEVRAKLKNVPIIVVCCAILHNMATKHRLDIDDDLDLLDEEDNLGQAFDTETGALKRDRVAASFLRL